MTDDVRSDPWFGKITDDRLEVMRTQIGIETEVVPWFRTVDEDAVWHLAQGVGDDNPLWWSRPSASATPVGRMFAPSTFLCAVQVEARKPISSARGTEGWLPGVVGLNGGKRWIWQRPVWVGETLRVTHQLHVREGKPRSERGSVVQQELFKFYGTDDLVAELYKTLLRFERGEAPTVPDETECAPTPLQDADRDDIARRYAEESSRRRGSTGRLWEDVLVGCDVPSHLKALPGSQWV